MTAPTDENYTLLGPIARDRIDIQAQYIVRYLDGETGEGLRFVKHWNYHQVLIHKDDVEEFVRRVRLARGLDVAPE